MSPGSVPELVEGQVPTTLRRGLPRVKGGEPWPPALKAPEPEPTITATATAQTTPGEAAPAVAVPAEAARADAGAASDSGAASDTGARDMRRGLPRAKGGEPWPPASVSPESVTPSHRTERSVAAQATIAPAASAQAGAPAADSTPAVGTASEAPLADTSAPEAGAMRRGLPRVPGGEPWPPAGTTARIRATSAQPLQESMAPLPETAAQAPDAAPQAPQATVPTTLPDAALADSAAVATRAASATAATAPAASPAPATAVTVARDLSAPLPFRRTVWQGAAPRHAGEAEHAPSRLRPTWPQAIGGLIGAAALGLLAVAAVFLMRAFLSLPFMQDFLAAYPGEYQPAVQVEPGFAPWIGWQHFFNVFLIVLIIRSGLRVRSEKRPTVFWTPRGDDKGKISLTLWFHQALDLLWVVNGVIFVVLLIVTGHWARIVPTSWEVFPNALSAALQYITFDWPTENGWVNYNSLQQLAYFATVFIAAPLAVITGVRMSGLWPKKAERLSKAYPVEWARALHFPVMLYFVVFIIVHVALVLLTGALRNLNHMYASQDVVSWTGFWVFLGSMVVVIAGWFAARPLVLAPIAKLFGKVSGR